MYKYTIYGDLLYNNRFTEYFEDKVVGKRFCNEKQIKDIGDVFKDCDVVSQLHKIIDGKSTLEDRAMVCKCVKENNLELDCLTPITDDSSHPFYMKNLKEIIECKPICNEKQLKDVKQVFKDCAVDDYLDRIFDGKSIPNDHAMVCKCVKDNNLDLDCLIPEPITGDPSHPFYMKTFKEIIECDKYKDHVGKRFCNEKQLKDVFDTFSKCGIDKVLLKRLSDGKSTPNDHAMLCKCVKDNKLELVIDCLIPEPVTGDPNHPFYMKTLKEIIECDKYKDHVAKSFCNEKQIKDIFDTFSKCFVDEHFKMIIDGKSTPNDHANVIKCVTDNNLDIDCLIPDRMTSDPSHPFYMKTLKEIIQYDKYKDHVAKSFCNEKQIKDVKHVFKDCAVDDSLDRIIDGKSTPNDHAIVCKCVKDNNLDIDCLILELLIDDPNHPFYMKTLKEIIECDKYKDHVAKPICNKKQLKDIKQVFKVCGVDGHLLQKIIGGKSTPNDHAIVCKCVKDNNLDIDCLILELLIDDPNHPFYMKTLKEIIECDKYKDHVIKHTSKPTKDESGGGLNIILLIIIFIIIYLFIKSGKKL